MPGGPAAGVAAARHQPFERPPHGRRSPRSPGQPPPTKAASAVAECVEAGIQNGFEAGLAAERKHLVSLRHTPEAREKLAAFLKR